MADKTTYIAGLDLGQAQEFTALAILERFESAGDPAAPERKREWHYAIRHLERYALGTSYPTVFERVVKLFASPPLSNSTLVVDQTGVGKAVVDMLRRARPKGNLRPVTITGGSAVVPDGAGYHIPKKELVSVMQVLLQSRRLQVARTLPEASMLIKELENFRTKVTSSTNDAALDWRERPQDDLVLGVAIAAWMGEHGIKQFWIR
jgi:hypothetical protein